MCDSKDLTLHTMLSELVATASTTCFRQLRAPGFVA